MTETARSAPWMTYARELEGLREIVGSRHEPKILEFYAEAGNPWVKDDETAWCAAFVGAMLARAGVRGTGSLAARSYLSWGQKLDRFVPGCIVVLKRGKEWQGHVGFGVSEAGSKVTLLGGNQGNAVSSKSFPKADVLGYRWPAGAGAPVAGHVADAGKMVAGKLPRAEVRAVQERLAALGYHEVGRADGDFGRRTRAALNAFRADNDLPLTTESVVTDADKAALLTAGPRPIGEERATGVPEDSRILADAGRVQAASLVGGGVAAIGAVGKVVEAVAGPAETVGGIVESLAPAKDLVGSLWPFILLIVVALIWLWARRQKRDEIEAYREGRVT